ncbi:MAG: isoprenyl transferase [Desulfobacula sp.]|uniref:isoprenyl transferase n=1 Tax=Desulfobacula sp. TaxID=2593537 RepID=UPI001D747EB7|nr:isoprenyl transferase [Desulfobacula sp.]MBT3484515.1 isoprenyl transferase [Desulfobacula sp.]MBT3803153.1 isoprenyl transferase [Desulfobacula sp.]MBT4024723.1 isoprenyl transferase [Desulfobacula sp.]MBT4197201.1 isoprenyl transferase [Desulfobacula sp.]
MKSNSTQDVTLNPEKLPFHLAIIMDGNGRWAKKRLMNRVKGHEQGSQTVRSIVTAARELGIGVLTLYAFSTENWARPKLEVKALMMLLKKFIISEREKLSKNHIRLNIIGQKHRLPPDVQKEIDITMALTKNNDKMVLNLALSYGSREEITNAVKQIVQKIESKDLNPEDISQDLISNHLYTKAIPDPDLIIRTSGEYRLSNFLLWQAAYSEIYITDTLWPDFSKDEFIEILNNFQNRDRRFGKVSCSISKDG